MRPLAILLGTALCLGLVTLAQAEVTQRGHLRVSVDGELSPTSCLARAALPSR